MWESAAGFGSVKSSARLRCIVSFAFTECVEMQS